MKKFLATTAILALTACAATGAITSPPPPVTTATPTSVCDSLGTIVTQAELIAVTADPATAAILQNLIQDATVCKDATTVAAAVSQNGVNGVNSFLMTVAKDFATVEPVLLPLVTTLLAL